MAKRRRTKGSGSIVKTSSGMFYYFWYDVTGKQHKKSLRTKNRAEAEKLAEDFTKAVHAKDKKEVLFQAAEAKEIIVSKNLPLENVWSEFLKTKPTAGEGTLANYKRMLKEFIKWLAVELPSVDSFTQVTLEMAKSYMEYVWQSGISANTSNYKRGALATITKALQNSYGIDSNYWLRIERKKGVQQKRLPLKASQVNKLLKFIDDDKNILPYQLETACLIKLCLFSGMRLFDAVNLNWDNIDLVNNYITYKPQKTQLTSGVSAQVPIFKPLLNAIDRLAKEGQYVLPSIQAHYSRNPAYIKKTVLSIIHTVTGNKLNNSKVQSVRNRSLYGCHSLRHTFATEAAKAGVTSFKLSRMLGDTIRTIDRFYVDVDLTKEPLSEFKNTLGAPSDNMENLNPNKQKLMDLIDNLPEDKIKDILNKLNP